MYPLAFWWWSWLQYGKLSSTFTVALVTEAFIFNFIIYNDVAIESAQREVTTRWRYWKHSTFANCLSYLWERFTVCRIKKTINAEIAMSSDCWNFAVQKWIMYIFCNLLLCLLCHFPGMIYLQIPVCINLFYFKELSRQLASWCVTALHSGQRNNFERVFKSKNVRNGEKIFAAHFVFHRLVILKSKNNIDERDSFPVFKCLVQSKILFYFLSK